MITKDSFSERRIRELHARHPQTDLQLIERQIYAFALLCRLKRSGKEFVFRGGTALHLLLPEPRRISIDIDILGQFEADDLRVLVDGSDFSAMEEDIRPGSPVPKRHFKFFYRSALNGISPYILLDVVNHPSTYPRLIRRPIRSALLDLEDSPLVTVPSIDGLLGDKLSAFAPSTIGIPLGSGRSMEIVKQVFDIGALFDAAWSVSDVMESYRRAYDMQRSFGPVNVGMDACLSDTIRASYLGCQRGLRGGINETMGNELARGVRQIQGHLLVRFTEEQLRVALAKAAYLAGVLLRGGTAPDDRPDRFSGDHLKELADAVIVGEHDLINRLRRSQPEAFYYWWRASSHQ